MASLPCECVFDGHNDTLLDIYLPDNGRTRSFLQQHDWGHMDLPRARTGGLRGGLFAVFVPNDPASWRQPEKPIIVTDTGYECALPPPLALDYAQRFTDGIVDSVGELEQQSSGQIRLVRSFPELEKCLADNTFAVVLHFEGAEAIDKDLKSLKLYYDRGLRSLGIVWSRPNAFGHGVPFKFPSSPDTGPGLSEAGIALVDECNRLGIMVDLAHINEKGFWDAASVTRKPLVVSHAGVHKLCPSARNLTDRQIDAIGESDGIIGVTFFVGDLRTDGKKERETPIAQIVRHIVYLAVRIGIDHVALGSDFDGATIPNEVGDVTGIPKIIAELRSQGFDDESIGKIAHGNWLRILRQTWND